MNRDLLLSRAIEDLRALGYRGCEPVMGIADCFEMTSPEGESVKIKIHKRSKLHGRYQYWYGINHDCLSLVDFVALWHEDGRRLPLVPTAFLRGVYGRMVKGSKAVGIGGPKVEDGRWHVDVTFRPGGQVVLLPTNWTCGEAPDITAFCQTIPSSRVSVG
jgi:hypothetical protein